METPKLNHNEIFITETGSKNDAEKYAVYAPFAGVILQVSEHDVFRLENAGDYPEDQQLQEMLKTLSKKSEKELLKIIQWNDISEITIHLNHLCNFSCSYCYSAKGRSNKSIDRDKLFAALSGFIDRKRTEIEKIKLVFSGGGDPLMSFSLLKEVIEFSEKRGKEQGFNIDYNIVTNGTLLSPAFIDLVKRFHISLVISFDVLEDVQNRQRGKYKKVCEGINYLIENGIYPGIRSTITRLNVHRMEEMVYEMVSKFPALGGIAFEPVLNPSLFADAFQLVAYYNAFIDHYFKAAELGSDFQLYVGNTVVLDAETCKERACLSKFTLTPEGEITACSRISSSKEDYYEYFRYGAIGEKGELIIDSKKLERIMQNNVYAYLECSSCIAKWHCGGGCLLARYCNNPEYFDCYCDFVRKMTVKSLLNQIK